MQVIIRSSILALWVCTLTFVTGQDLSEKKSDLRVCDAATCRYGGTCRESGADVKCVCRFHCHKKYIPVCGSNGDTYQNECFLRRAACKQQRDISLTTSRACYTGEMDGLLSSFPDDGTPLVLLEIKCALTPTRGTTLSFPDDETVRVDCAPGYWTIGTHNSSVTVTCQENRQWSSTPGCEEIKCSLPDILSGVH